MSINLKTADRTDGIRPCQESISGVISPCDSLLPSLNFLCTLQIPRLLYLYIFYPILPNPWELFL